MTQLSRKLGFLSALSIVVGGVIGSGIFMVPSAIAAALPSASWILAVWIGGGLITLCGALSNAEVAAMFPETGGQYVFFRKMYGDFFAFLYGWSAFAVFNTAGNASIAYVFAHYADYFLHLPRLAPEVEQSFRLVLPGVGTFFPLENIGVKALTIGLIVVLTTLNSVSTQQGGLLQRVFTALKIVAIAALVIGLLTRDAGYTVYKHLPDPTMPTQLWQPFMVALASAFWAYDGWNNITFVAGEIKQPQRDIPLSLGFGLLACMVIYALVNTAFMSALPLSGIIASEFVAADAATSAWGAIGGSLIALMVVLSTFGAVNANILATARVTFALGQENRAFTWAGRVHPRFGTPANALWLQAIWSSLFIISGSFDMLIGMLIFVTWFFYGMSALGLFILRHRLPDTPRPYRVIGYPVVPAVFVLFTAFFLVTTLVSDIQKYMAGETAVINSVLGICIVLTGVPFYFFRK